MVPELGRVGSGGRPRVERVEERFEVGPEIVDADVGAGFVEVVVIDGADVVFAIGREVMSSEVEAAETDIVVWSRVQVGVCSQRL